MKILVVLDHRGWEMMEVSTHIDRAAIDIGLFKAKMRR